MIFGISFSIYFYFKGLSHLYLFGVITLLHDIQALRQVLNAARVGASRQIIYLVGVGEVDGSIHDATGVVSIA